MDHGFEKWQEPVRCTIIAFTPESLIISDLDPRREQKENAMTSNESDKQWAFQQIEAYGMAYPRYSRMAQVLQQVLEKAARQYAPLAILQTRPKSIPSFAEKAIRKMKVGRYSDPLVRMTDLCGGRVITQTLAEVRAFSDFIEKHFIVDENNSVDVSERLKPSEFGYRSIHYIVQFKRGIFPTREVPVEIPEELYPDATTPMKAEIQVRTVTEHAWADFVHDRVYKSAFAIPNKWQRELAVLAGMLEQTDQSFTRIQAGLRTYAASYGSYLNEDQLKDEIGILESVLTCDPDNPDLAHRIGKLAMELGDWQKAIDIFSKYVGSGYQPILRDLGVVLCKVNAGQPQGEPYQQGQKYLEMASAPPYRDSDALASLAGTWKKFDEGKTRDYYRQAFELDPTDPYAVSNYLVYEIIHQRNLTPAALMRPTLTAAIQRCRDQAEVGMNMPWAFYNLGIFHLLLGQPYESLDMYLKAVQASPTDWMIETSLRLLDDLSVVREMIVGYDWVHTLLMLGRVAKFKHKLSMDQIVNLGTTCAGPMPGPVVILAGGTSQEISMDEYCHLLLEGFRGFRGIIIGGATTAGVSGLLGKVQAAYPETITTIGYAPARLPEGTEIDSQYRQVRKTGGQNFSALESLQSWVDIIASAIVPSQVKLLGINGGKISAFEYRLALMLGASVGVIANSGREADCLFKDPYWGNSVNLRRLSADQKEIEAFIMAEGKHG
jgi:ppGpp synthetase/RelA/SpoT-type nucleotidyltranferase